MLPTRALKLATTAGRSLPAAAQSAVPEDNASPKRPTSATSVSAARKQAVHVADTCTKVALQPGTRLPGHLSALLAEAFASRGANACRQCSPMERVLHALGHR